MTDYVANIAAKLTKAQKRACLAMTELPQHCGKQTFTHGGAWGLHQARSRGDGKLTVLEYDPRGVDRDTYRLTSLGIAVRDYLIEQGKSDERA